MDNTYSNLDRGLVNLYKRYATFIMGQEDKSPAAAAWETYKPTFVKRFQENGIRSLDPPMRQDWNLAWAPTSIDDLGYLIQMYDDNPDVDNSDLILVASGTPYHMGGLTLALQEGSRQSMHPTQDRVRSALWDAYKDHHDPTTAHLSLESIWQDRSVEVHPTALGDAIRDILMQEELVGKALDRGKTDEAFFGTGSDAKRSAFFQDPSNSYQPNIPNLKPPFHHQLF